MIGSASVRLGVVGTGFIARNLVREISRTEEFVTSRMLTRRPSHQLTGFPDGVVTNSIDDLVTHSDVIIECSGDPVWATEVVAEAVKASKPVVTMDTEFHITSGSAFVGEGIVTEAAGDQPGCLAQLHEEAVEMGFTPIAYGNMKGFLNPDPTPEDMEYWGDRQGISLAMVTAFTDGTKVQAEQILVGNHFGATIAKDGLVGAEVPGIEEASSALVAEYGSAGKPITDFVVSSALPHGVFIVATHDDEQKAALAYYKLGPGPYYTIIRNNIFVHLEILKTVRRVLDSGRILLDNSAVPELGLGALCKADLAPGHVIKPAIGGFDVRGHAVRIADHPGHVPIGLLEGATVERRLERGQLIDIEDVSLPENAAARAWDTVRRRVVTSV